MPYIKVSVIIFRLIRWNTRDRKKNHSLPLGHALLSESFFTREQARRSGYPHSSDKSLIFLKKVCVRVCVCWWEIERERETERQRDRDRNINRGRKKETERKFCFRDPGAKIHGDISSCYFNQNNHILFNQHSKVANIHKRTKVLKIGKSGHI